MNTRNVGPAEVPPPGFPFDADSPLRRHAEPATFLLIPYIAGLAVLNDPIAAAVKEHSAVDERPWGRLFGTARSAAKLVFGDDEETARRAQRLWHFHQNVAGSYEGVDYSANDTRLQTNVLGAVFNGLETVPKRGWVKPWGDDREGVYQDVRRFGMFFGIAESEIPPNANEMDEYWEGMISGNFLLQSDISHQMAQLVFRFEHREVPKRLSRLGQAVWVTSLDERLQEKADLIPNELDRRLARRFDTFMRNTYGRTPHKLREQAVPAMGAVDRLLTPLLGPLSAAKSKVLPT